MLRMTSKTAAHRTSLHTTLHHKYWECEQDFYALHKTVGSRTKWHSTLHQKAMELELDCLQLYTKSRRKSSRIAFNITPQSAGNRTEFHSTTHPKKKGKSNKKVHQNVHMRAMISGQVSKSGCAFRRWLFKFSLRTWPSKPPESWQQRHTNPRKFSGCKSRAIFCAHRK